MNKVKQGFDQQFGDFREQQANVKQRVLAKQKNKRPVRWHYSLIAALLLVAVGGFLVSQLPGNQQSSAKVATISERYFEVMYFDTYYLSQEFNRSAENYEALFHSVVHEAALIDYAKSKGIVVTEQEKQAAIDGFIQSFKEGIKSSDMAKFRYTTLFDEMNLDVKSYAKLLGEQQLVAPLYTNKLFEQLDVKMEQSYEDEQYVALLGEALTAFNAKYYQDIEAMLEDFKPVSSDGISATVETLYTAYGDYRIIELDEKLYFAAKDEAVNTFLLSAMPELETISQQEKLGYLCTYTLPHYIKAAQKVADETGAKKEQQFLELLNILKQTTELY